MTDPAISNDTDTDESGTESEICVPLQAVEVDGTPPEVGDKITVHETVGTVTRVEGQSVYMDPETFDGVPAPEEEKEKSIDDEGDELRNKVVQNEQDQTMEGMQ